MHDTRETSRAVPPAPPHSQPTRGSSPTKAPNPLLSLRQLSPLPSLVSFPVTGWGPIRPPEEFTGPQLHCLSFRLPEPAPRAGSASLTAVRCSTRTETAPQLFEGLPQIHGFRLNWAFTLGPLHPFSREIVLHCKCDQGTALLQTLRRLTGPCASGRRPASLPRLAALGLPLSPVPLPSHHNPMV